MKKILAGLRSHTLYRSAMVLFLIVFSVGFLFQQTVQASTPLSKVGTLDFSYGITPPGEPTAEKPENKLWWNDGFWWGSLLNETAGVYHIYRLNWGTQDWEDTGIQLDDRPNTRADILWDSATKKLYVASHVFSLIGSKVSQSLNYGRLYRYTYDGLTQTYALDSGFPVTVNQDKTETMVLDKDSAGRLWVTYVSRNPSVNPEDAQVYINRTTKTNDDKSWGTAYSLVNLFTEAHVSTDDIVSLIAFNNKIGVLWSNLIDGNFYFAYHDDTQSYDTGWVLQKIDSLVYLFSANDHIHLAKDSAGDVFATIKTTSLGSGSQIGLLAREVTTGVFSFLPLSDANNNDTRPIVVVDDAQNTLNIFNTSIGIGGVICYRSLTIVHPVSNMVVTPDNCRSNAPLTGSGIKLFIADSQYTNINNATSTKQNVNATTGLVVLASDNVNGQVYVHNVIGNPPPVVTQRVPGFNATNVAVNAPVLVTFSKDMNASTLTSSSFKLSSSGGSVSGTVAYDIATRTASFTPTNPLSTGTAYTVTLTTSIKDKNGQVLYGASETWQFLTQLSAVQFNQATYTVLENAGSAVITVMLDQPSSQTVTVAYATSDGTGLNPGDYTATNGTLTFTSGQTTKTFSVLIPDDAVQDGNKTVNLTLSNPTNAILGNQATAVLTIEDDDQSLVAFNPGSYTVDEGVGSATITVTLSKAAIQTVTVDYATTDGTATAGVDFTAASGTLTFDPGQTSKSFQVPINNDALYEEDETVQLNLTNPVNASLGVPNDVAILTIQNDDPMPQAMLSSDSIDVSENAGQATITVLLSDPSGVSSQVNYQTADYTAIDGVDYTDTHGTLTFAPGVISQTISIPLLDDTLNEPQKTFNLILSDPSNVELSVPYAAIVTINDNDPQPTIQFEQDQYTGVESSGSVTVTVTLSTASGQSVTIDYATSDGTATGADYQAVHDTLTFLPGETSKEITLKLTKDNIPEYKETFYLTLSNPIKGALGSWSMAPVTIVDGSEPVYLPLVRR